jgi:hypothetical protein
MIAWISHHLPENFGGKLVGGAEMTDATLLANAPVEVKTFLPHQWKEAMDYEQIVITGTDLLSPYAMLQLAKKNPVVAIHHEQTHNEHRATLINSSRLFMARTPRHLEIELAWTQPKVSTWVTSPIDITEITQKPKEDFALWAARMHNQKGPKEAQAWADQREIPLVMLTDRPRSEVLETMSRAKHFVFLPNNFDAEPRAVIEAVLSGCQVHTNELAGISSIPKWQDRDVMTELVTGATKLFWDRILA